MMLVTRGIPRQQGPLGVVAVRDEPMALFGSPKGKWFRYFSLCRKLN